MIQKSNKIALFYLYTFIFVKLYRIKLTCLYVLCYYLYVVSVLIELDLISIKGDFRPTALTIFIGESYEREDFI